MNKNETRVARQGSLMDSGGCACEFQVLFFAGRMSGYQPGRPVLPGTSFLMTNSFEEPRVIFHATH